MFDPEPVDPERGPSLGRCQCGLADYGEGRDFREHAAWHLRWSLGIRSNAWTVVAQPEWLVKVTDDSPMVLRRLAWQIARLMQKEKGYDFCPIPDPRHGVSPLGVAYIAMDRHREDGRRVVGLLHRSESFTTVDFDEPRKSVKLDELPPDERPLVTHIFVCGAYRGRGLAKAMMRRMATIEGRDTTDYAWMGPLSEGGIAVARSLSPGGRFRVGWEA